MGRWAACPNPFLSGGERPKYLDEALCVEPKPIIYDAAIGRDYDEPRRTAGAVCLHDRGHAPVEAGSATACPKGTRSPYRC